jgi:hypothetical protein
VAKETVLFRKTLRRRRMKTKGRQKEREEINETRAATRNILAISKTLQNIR